MNWKSLFSELRSDAVFSMEISTERLQEIQDETGIKVSGELLDLLLQTDGIRDKKFGDFLVFDSEQIISHHQIFVDCLMASNLQKSNSILFFADNGCGELFGLEARRGLITSPHVVIFYPIDGEFKIIAPNLQTWATEWYSGRLST